MQKAKRIARNSGLFVILLAAFVSTGCLFEKLAWSPDGRWLLYAAESIGKIWRWDSQTGKMDSIQLASGDFLASDNHNKVLACRYLPSGEKAVVMTDKGDGNNGDACMLFLLDLNATGNNASLLAADATQTFEITPDDAIYYATMDDKKSEYSLHKHTQKSDNVVWTTHQELGFIRMAPDGKRMVFTSDRELCLLDLDDNTTRPLITRQRNHEDKNKLLWPTWLGNRRVLYMSLTNDTAGDLNVYDFDDATTHALMQGAMILDPPSPSPDGKRVAVATTGRNAAGDYDGNVPGQVVILDLATNKAKPLTNEDFGARSPAFAPDGKRLAYLVAIPTNDGGDESPMLWVRDLETGQDTAAWRNDAERLYATALTLQRAGRPAEALATLDDLVARFPGANYEGVRKGAEWMRAKLLLQPQLLDLDAAYAALKLVDPAASDKNGSHLVSDAFWRDQDRIAIDPADDNIVTYATPESIKADHFNTDSTRDLRGLWERSGKKRIYLRVDYGSNNDLSGMTYQDTWLLFTRDPGKAGKTAVTPNAQWDRELLSEVRIRHWFSSSYNSQYDVAILNGKGDVTMRYDASGFEPPENPIFGLVSTYDEGDAGSAVYAIDKRVLKMDDARDYGVQVLTFKGGIDKTETPAASTGCDVADAFGPTNTAARLKKAAEPVIEGVAGTFKAE